jgi:hypothetical protein
MKIFRILITIAILFAGLMPLAAQENSSADDKKSEYYYVNVPLEKVYPYRKGYVVLYRKGVNQMAQAYLPLEWFTSTAGKGDLIRIGSGASWPYLSIYYKEGAFSHVRLYVRREPGHETWGNIPLNINIDDRFENVDDLKLEF